MEKVKKAECKAKTRNWDIWQPEKECLRPGFLFMATRARHSRTPGVTRVGQRWQLMTANLLVSDLQDSTSLVCPFVRCGLGLHLRRYPCYAVFSLCCSIEHFTVVTCKVEKPRKKKERKGKKWKKKGKIDPKPRPSSVKLAGGPFPLSATATSSRHHHHEPPQDIPPLPPSQEKDR